MRFPPLRILSTGSDDFFQFKSSLARGFRDRLIKQARLLKSSSRLILDDAAVAALRRGKYPDPVGKFLPGQIHNRLMVTLNYRISSQD